ncbi:hypothetical protein ACFOD1_02580 [Pseudidiomarina halophila]|uniref:Fimbrial assembly protein n=1 Tax=Pseudidiomarina halophila TaxID=1449799 RepID=A0A432XX06_9GAMM|nr:hypothetical protein [Pseudidiomarina halophila]RUO53154.1 hypothetical protein CWI69_09035 [Pseudidiomarina halophila]
MSKTRPNQSNYLNRLSAQLTQGLWRVAADFSWYQGTSSEPVAAPTKRVPVVVLARQLYQEQWQTFAIRSQRELKKIVQLRDDGDASVMHFIGAEHDGQRQVLTVRLTERGLAAAAQGYVVLPETLVLNAALDNGFYQIGADSRVYFMLCDDKQWKSALQSPLLKTAETAKLALGAAAEQTPKTITLAQLQALLPQGVKRLGYRMWQQGWQRVSTTRAFPWRQTLIASTAVVALYAAISTLYLFGERWWLERQLAAIDDDVAVVLQQQTAMQDARQNIEALEKYQTNWQAVNQFWQVYRLIEEQQLQLNFLRGDFQTFMLSGVADGALPFLQKLNASPAVAEADFDAPVRSNGSEQRFIIKFAFTESDVWQQKVMPADTASPTAGEATDE